MHKLKEPQIIADVTAKYTQKTTAYIDGLTYVDEIARQYLPDVRELDVSLDENADPIGDQSHSPVKGIVHRYPDRVLLKPHHACAVYCRFCFRRDMVGRNGEVLNEAELDAALDYIRDHKEIWEVILTGGDPLALSARRLKSLFEALNAIDHVKSIRIHTRVPVAAPELVTDDLCRLISDSNIPVIVSVHCNHAAELGEGAKGALKNLHAAGSMLVSQSVLLKGVNDCPDKLEALFRSLIENRVKPYYLHHADKARGTGHFRLKLSEGLDIYSHLRGRLSGVCVPQYMLDIPGGFGKVSIDSLRVIIKDDHAEVTDHNGVVHIYKD